MKVIFPSISLVTVTHELKFQINVKHFLKNLLQTENDFLCFAKESQGSLLADSLLSNNKANRGIRSDGSEHRVREKAELC